MLKIFNFKQANFLIRNGCKVHSVGHGEIDKKPYVKFVINNEFNLYMTKWKNNKK